MEQQEVFSRIPRSFVDHIRGSDGKGGETFPNGYVKVCAAWLQRLWGVEDSLEGLNEITSQFDACGGYNGEGAIVPNKRDPFAIEYWSNALDFLEWFGV